MPCIGMEVNGLFINVYLLYNTWITDTGVYDARSILAFDENNIWITSGSQITNWNGIRQTIRHSSPVYVNKLWGTDNQ